MSTEAIAPPPANANGLPLPGVIREFKINHLVNQPYANQTHINTHDKPSILIQNSLILTFYLFHFVAVYTLLIKC